MVSSSLGVLTTRLAATMLLVLCVIYAAGRLSLTGDLWTVRGLRQDSTLAPTSRLEQVIDAE